MATQTRNMQNQETEKKRERNTWLKQYHTAKSKEGFDAKRFAGRITAERLAVAEKSINAIGTPLLSSEANFEVTDKAIEYIRQHLENAIEKLVGELQNGKKSIVKTNDVVPF